MGGNKAALSGIHTVKGDEYVKEATHFSLALTQNRLNKHLTQKEVAARLGIERSTYAYYENSKTKPSCEMILFLSEILETDYHIFIEAVIKDINEERGNPITVGSKPL